MRVHVSPFLHRGFGFVTYVDQTGVDKVLAQNRHELDSKTVSLLRLSAIPSYIKHTDNQSDLLVICGLPASVGLLRYFLRLFKSFVTHMRDSRGSAPFRRLCARHVNASLLALHHRGNGGRALELKLYKTF